MYFRAADVGLFGRRGLKFGATALMFSNKHFDPVAAAACTTSTSSTTGWPKKSASTASC
jgi:hypothetical protein